MKLKISLTGVGIIICCTCMVASAQEEIVLSTYYPAPYGEYNELTTNKLAVGSTATIPANDGDVEISGTVTIGAYTLPNTDGADGQVLTTDGSSNVTWEEGAAGLDCIRVIASENTGYSNSGSIAQCPNDYPALVGGGGRCYNGGWLHASFPVLAGETETYYSYTVTGPAWLADCYHEPDGSTYTSTAYAICCKD